MRRHALVMPGDATPRSTSFSPAIHGLTAGWPLWVLGATASEVWMLADYDEILRLRRRAPPVEVHSARCSARGSTAP